jgi:hypothetical protein
MTKTKTRLGSFYTEFELSRVELRVTRLTREFRVLVPGLGEVNGRLALKLERDETVSWRWRSRQLLCL